MRRLALPLIVSLALCASAHAADDGWRVEQDKDGIRVSTRAVPGWSIREFRGEVRIAARLTSLVAAILDPDAAHQLNDMVREVRVLDRESPARYRFYTAVHMPWPLSDRDLVTQRSVTQDAATLAVAIEDDAIAGAQPPRKGFVRIDKSHQHWNFTPAGKGEVLVTMRELADPNGPIPSSIINMMSVDVPHKTLTNLKKVVQQPRYAEAQLAWIREPGG